VLPKGAKSCKSCPKLLRVLSKGDKYVAKCRPKRVIIIPGVA